MTEQEIDAVLANLTPEQLERGVERLRYSVSSFELGREQGRSEVNGGWSSWPVAVFHFDELPSANELVKLNRTHWAKGNKKVKEVLSAAYQKCLDYFQDNDIETFYETGYQRTARQRPKALTRAFEPVIKGACRVLVEVPEGRDVDGHYTKAVFDGWQEANLLADDSQIDDLQVTRMHDRPAGGPIVIYVFEQEKDQEQS